MKFVRIVQNIIEIIFILFCGFLAVSSLFVHGAVNFETYEEKITLESRNPFLAILETVVFILVLLVISRLVTAGIHNGGNRNKGNPNGNFETHNEGTEDKDKGSEKIRRRTLIVGAAMVIFIAVGGLVWIHVNPYPPYSDQKKVWDAAVALAEGNPEGIDIAYFWIYPHQKKMAVVFWPIARFPGADPAFSIRVVNVISAVLLSAGILALCGDIMRGSNPNSRSAGRKATDNAATTVRKKENAGIRFLQNQTAGALLCLIFTPIVIYTCFVYGTLMAAAASVWSFHGILRLNQTGKLPYGLLPLLLLPFANLCYSSTRIAIVAAVITLILPVFIRKPNDMSADTERNGKLPSAVRVLSAGKEDPGVGKEDPGAGKEDPRAEKEDPGAEKEDSGAGEESGTGVEREESFRSVPALPAWFRVLLAAGIVILTMAAGNAADAFFDRISGLPEGDPYPYVQDLYMGITSTEEEATAGPGSFVNGKDKSNWNGSNAGEVNSVYWKKTEDVLQDYLHHRRSLRFFIRKTWYQWLDPWFSSLTMTFSLWMRDVEIPDALREFMTGRPVRWMQHLLTILMSTVYLMALWNAVAGLHGRWKRKKMQERGELSAFYRVAEAGWQDSASFLFEIYFIGGFVFQLVWESKARYCFPYFLCLIPLAAGGICSFSELFGQQLFSFPNREAGTDGGQTLTRTDSDENRP